MKAASLVFLVAAALAASLLLGAVSFGASVPSPGPIALRDSHPGPGVGPRAGVGSALAGGSHGPAAPRTEIPSRVEQTTLSAYALPRSG